jgi:hypothetical protein
MAEPLGVWAMELMHVLTGFADIRCQPAFVDCVGGQGEMDSFDEMAKNGGMHPSAYTKLAIDWIDAPAVARHVGRQAAYDLHAVGLVQPPPAGRGTAVRIGSEVPYLMVEARQMVQFESASQLEPGIPSQGVIVYRVQTTNPLGFAEHRMGTGHHRSRLPAYQDRTRCGRILHLEHQCLGHSGGRDSGRILGCHR